MNSSVPVITIDGLAASGKGAVASRVADTVGWNLLDSGLFYRVVAFLVDQYQISLNDEAPIVDMIRDETKFVYSNAGVSVATLPSASASPSQNTFIVGDAQREGYVRWNGADITKRVRSDQISKIAARVAASEQIREVLRPKQRQRRQPPGLVADGRDMGTVIFPDAPLKVFLEASLEVRVARRIRQLGLEQTPAGINRIERTMRDRDSRDTLRDVAPAVPATDAVRVDSSQQTLEETVAFVIDLAQERNIVA